MQNPSWKIGITLSLVWGPASFCDKNNACWEGRILLDFYSVPLCPPQKCLLSDATWPFGGSQVWITMNWSSLDCPISQRCAWNRNSHESHIQNFISLLRHDRKTGKKKETDNFFIGNQKPKHCPTHSYFSGLFFSAMVKKVDIGWSEMSRPQF